jgi:hypothetical protein
MEEGDRWWHVEEEALKALDFAADCSYGSRSFREQTEAALAAAAALTNAGRWMLNAVHWRRWILDAGENFQRTLEEIGCEPGLSLSQRTSAQMFVARSRGALLRLHLVPAPLRVQ